MNDASASFEDAPIPRLGELRRIPRRYRHMLPLSFMKRYRCLVVGAAGGKLTVAITSTRHMAALESIQMYTGKAVFPVLIHPRRMQLLLQQIERCEQCKRIFLSKRHQAQGSECYKYTLQRLEIHAILKLITSQRVGGF